MHVSAAVCVGLAAWCSLGTIALMGHASVDARVALLPPWWLLPLLIAVVFAVVRLARLSRDHVSPLFGSAVVILPWLPVPVPAVALIWVGPFAMAVWLAVVVGLFLANRRAIHSRWLTDAHRAPLVAAALALTLYGASAWWLSPILPEGDSPHYLIIAQSLIEDGDLRIENNHQRGDYLAYSLHAARPDYLRRGVDGAIYSIHAPGLPVLIAPAFLFFGYPGVVAFLGLVAAAGTALVWHVAYRTTSSAAAWFGWACCAMTTPFFFQATQVFPDGLAAACVLVGALPLLLGDIRRDALWASDATSPRDSNGVLTVAGFSDRIWLVSGGALAVLPWLHARLVFLAAAVALCAFFRLQRVRQFVLFAAVPAVSAAAWFGYFSIIYGTANPAAPYGPYTQTRISNMARGLPGLLFDEQFGLVPNAPVYGVVIAGVIAAVLRRRRWGWELLTIVVPYMLAIASYQLWWAGTSSPARLLTPLALLLGVAAARIWHEARASATRVLGVTMLGASVLCTAALLGPDRGRLLFNFRDGVALWLEWGNTLLDLPKGLPSLFRDTPTQALLKAGLWGGSFGVAWLTLRALGGRTDRRSGPSASRLLSWPTTWCLAMSVMVALTLAWGVDHVQPLTPETSEIDLVRHASPFRAVAYDFGMRDFLPSSMVLSRARVRTDPQRRAADAAWLLSAARVPASTYRVLATGSGALEGTLSLHVGATPRPLWTATLSGGRSRAVGPPLRLPVDVRSLVVEGDEAARRTIATVQLEPVVSDPHVDQQFRGTAASAHRAVSYDAAGAYFLDENAYPEPSGLWVAGGRAAQILVESPGTELRLFLRNAPVDNTVTIDVDGTRHEVQLREREETIITLPRPNPGPYVLLRIHPRAGFRPSQADPANEDLRYLGCWVEFR